MESQSADEADIAHTTLACASPLCALVVVASSNICASRTHAIATSKAHRDIDADKESKRW